MPDLPTFVDDCLLRVGHLDFHCDLFVEQAPEGRIPVMKPRDLVERYLGLSEDIRPAVIVELGIRRGGSTVLLSELNRPDKLIALEISPDPVPVLEDYIAQRGLAGVVCPRYGVDQSDRARVAAILAEELGGGLIDLVIDDASHLYEETVSSFETIFPHVRTGGLFIIEDWNADHLVGDAIAATLKDVDAPDHDDIERRLQETIAAQGQDPASRRIPLTQMAVELVVARSSTGDAIRKVTVNSGWVVVERGADELDPATFRLADHVHDHFGFAAAKPALSQ